MFKNKLGKDSPIPKFKYLKIRRGDGVKSLTTLQEGEFKMLIDGCINLFNSLESYMVNLGEAFLSWWQILTQAGSERSANHGEDLRRVGLW